MEQTIQNLIDVLITHATDLLLPMMVTVFIVGFIMRILIYYTLRRNEWFVREFDKRASKFLHSIAHRSEMSFFISTKRLLEKTFYELFEIRAIMKRRKPDLVTPMIDRVFLVKEGVAWLVKDSLRMLKHQKHNSQPKMLEISKNIFQRNPCFSNVFGIFPAGVTNDMLNVLPGVFIITGIFGTFLGIMKALPELSGMDLTDVEQTKLVMDQFLLKTSFAMSTSLVGIVLSLSMMFINTLLSPEKAFVRSVDRFEAVLDLLWNRSTNNELPEDIPDFDENRDPIEALAEEALKNVFVHKSGKSGREAVQEGGEKNEKAS